MQELGRRESGNNESHDKSLVGTVCHQDTSSLSSKSRLDALIHLGDSTKSKYSNNPIQTINDYNSELIKEKPVIMTSDTLEAYGHESTSSFPKKINNQAFIYDSVSNHTRSVHQCKVKKIPIETMNSYNRKGPRSKIN